MPITVTQTGRDLVINEVDRVITFSNLGLDWASAGYTLKLGVTPPSGTETEYDLAAVVGTATSAKKEGTTGMFTTAGNYQFKIYAYSSGTKKLITEYVDVPVRP